MQFDSKNITSNKIKYDNSYCSPNNVSFTAQPCCSSTTTAPAQCAQTNTQPYQYQHYQYPQGQIYATVGQNTVSYPVQPGASGVNIQIFNPCVSTPGSAAPSYNVNSPVYYPNCPNNQNGTTQGNTGTDNKQSASTDTKEKSTEKTEEKDKIKTEKKQVVELTDDYIKALESYLNSQDRSVRFNAAKKVCDRIEEDPARKDDPALTALINKMLQDPVDKIRFLALTELDSGNIVGNDTTARILTDMQKSKGAFGQDAVDANNILLKMKEKVIEKEVPVKDNSKTTTKTTKTEKETTKAG